MKKIILFLLTAALLLTSAAGALADTTLRFGSHDDGDYPISSAVTDDHIYVLTDQKLFVWKDGDDAFSEYPNTPAEMQEELTNPMNVFVWDDEPWILYSKKDYDDGKAEGFSAVKADLKESGVTGIGDRFDLSKEELGVASGHPDSEISITDLYGIGSKLYMILDTDMAERQLYCWDGEEKKLKEVNDTKTAKHIFGQNDNKLMILCQDDEQKTAWLEEVDPENGKTEKVGDEFPVDENAIELPCAAFDRSDRTLYYQDGEQLMAAPGAIRDGAKTVAYLNGKISLSGLPAGMLSGKRYVYVDENAANIIDVSAAREQKPVFRVSCGGTEIAVEALDEMRKLHPELQIVPDRKIITDSEITDAFLKKDAGVDVYILRMSSAAFDTLYRRGFLPEITAPDAVAKVAKMYPAIREAVTKDGKLIALPSGIAVTSGTAGLNRDGLKGLGVDPSKFPTDWNGYLKKMEEVGKKANASDEYRSFEGLNRKDVISSFLPLILTTYARDKRDSGLGRYNTPALAETLNTLLKLDYSGMGIPDNDDEASPDASDKQRIFTELSSTECGMNVNQNCPQPLTVLPDGKPGLPLDITVAIINPASGHPEAAQDFMNILQKHLDKRTSYTFSDEENEPVKDPTLQTMLEDFEKEIKQIEQALEKASGLEKEELTEKLEEQRMLTDMFKDSQWLISKESLENFRKNADKLYPVFYDFANGAEAEELKNQLLGGEITVERFLQTLDEKAEMRAKEDEKAA